MRYIISLFVAIFCSLQSHSQTITVTFSVDMSYYTNNFTDVQFYRSGNLYNMTDVGNNIFEYSVSVPPFQQANYTYKFAVDGNLESFNGNESCIINTPNDTLRVINLTSTLPSVVCYGLCDPCSALNPGCTDVNATNYNVLATVDDGTCEYNVTFILDMREVSDLYNIPEVNGTFNSWCGNCASMTDSNNDSIWEITIQLLNGTYEFKYSADDWNIQEYLYEFDNCVVGASPYINRELTVNGNTVLDTICWNRCYSCDVERNFYNVTFEVDMSNVNVNYTAPEVNGTFNNWCGNCWMLDPNGSGVFSKSFNIDTSLHTYKFSADNWSIEEILDSSLSCVLASFDSTGILAFVNRELRLTSDTIISVCWESCSPCVSLVYGCTNPLACNYNPNANVDDGSCLTIYGCTQPLSINYNPLAQCDDSSCIAIVFGCTDSLACNYSINANVDDGSCLTVYGCTNPSSLNYDSLAQCDDGSCIAIVMGCTDSLACNYYSSANVDNGSCLTIYGCTNQTATNYNPIAECDDGSCVFTVIVFGCIDPLACNYDSIANTDNGSCIFPDGCTDSTAFNYNPLALCDDDSCIPFIFGCLDSTAFNYNPLANTDDSSCIAYIYGCLDSLACNYDPMCNFDDGSCLLVFGCTDTTALNFNPLAECDDSSCIASFYGCTDSLACNYNVFANVDDSSCYNLFGCLDSLAYNYDSLANCNDSSLCLYEYNVTFQLDLRGQTTINYTTPEVNGVFNSWCGNCAQMTDLNNDSIWEITIPILEGIGPVIGAPGYEYKFSADNWNIQETLFSGDLCTYTAFGFTNRYLHVTKDTVLDPVCWGSCVDCYAPQSAYNVTFRLDMNNATNFTIPEINGEFNNWCGNCWPMNDIDGDNIWEFTTLVDTSLQEFKFSADNWSIQENLDSTLFCVKTTIDSLGAVFVNRYLHVYSDTVLDIVCWNECDSCNIDIIPSWDCVADGCYDPGTGSGQFLDSLLCILNCNLNNTEYTLLSDQVLIYPNPVNDVVTIESTEDIDKIKVYNVIGEVILEKENPKFLTNFSLSNYSSNIFLIEINSGNQVLHYKILKAK